MKFPFVSVRYCSLENDQDDLPNTGQLSAWRLSRSASRAEEVRDLQVSVDLVGGHFDHTVTPGVGIFDGVGDEFVDQKAEWDGVIRRQRHCVSTNSNVRACAVPFSFLQSSLMKSVSSTKPTSRLDEGPNCCNAEIEAGRWLWPIVSIDESAPYPATGYSAFSALPCRSRISTGRQIS
jgi:hypothetical protein